jgi:hypothetical protein
MSQENVEVARHAIESRSDTWRSNSCRLGDRSEGATLIEHADGTGLARLTNTARPQWVCELGRARDPRASSGKGRTAELRTIG